MQQQRLAQEMQDATVVSIIQRKPKMKASRSLPAVLLKPAPKSRVSGMLHVTSIVSSGKECGDLVCQQAAPIPPSCCPHSH